MSMNQPTAKHPGEMRVLTLNLWGRNGAWTERRSVLIEGLRALQPDLVALQEAIKTDEYDQVADLLGPQWRIVHQQSRDAEGMGISIASRWPVELVQELDLHITTRTGDFPCGTLIAEVTVPEPIGPIQGVWASDHFGIVADLATPHMHRI